MELPICNGPYSNESDISDVEFLCGVGLCVAEYLEQCRPFFSGLCNFCNKFGSLGAPLQRCGGCQLVGYCSRDCQRADRPAHKYVCKGFPVVNGKNVLYTTSLPWKRHIAGVRQQAAHLSKSQITVQSILKNPRVCCTCREARSDRLSDCKCGCVSYCSKWCANADKSHKEDCRRIALIACSYSMLSMQDVAIWDDLVCEEFTPIFTWNDISSLEQTLSLRMMIKENNIWDVTYSLANERLSYPMSLLYSLQTLPERRLGQEHHPLEELTTLTVHVVNSSPLFDSKPWECFMHRLPKLKQLNVVFIMQGKTFNESFNQNYTLNLQRCKDCQIKNRIITYSVQQMLYHMYFSSAEYTDPDIVVIYGINDEMPGSSSDEDDAIHSEISYSNMTSSPDTVLVLMDETKELVKQGVRFLNTARPVDQLVPIQMNLFRGFTSKRADIDSESAIVNEKCYFTCLRRK